MNFESAAQALEQLRSQVKIGYFGLSNLRSRDIPELESSKGKFLSFQNQYSLACRDFEQDILELSQRLEMTPMTWGSLGQGILTGKYDKNVTFGSDDRRSRAIYVNFYGEKLLKNLEIVECLRKIAASHEIPVSAAVVRFILDYLPGSVVLCGVKRPAQILETAKTLNRKLSSAELAQLEEISR